MREVLAVCFALGGIWLLGAALLEGLGLRRCRPLRHAQFALDFAVGNGALAILWIMASLTGLHVRPWTLWVAALGAVGFVLVRRVLRPHRAPVPHAPQPIAPARKWPAYVVLALFALTLAGRLANAYVTPMYGDGRYIWAFKAKVMFLQGEMARGVFSSEAAGRYRYTALDHPPAVPALQAAAYQAMGQIDERAAKLVEGVYWLGIAAVLFSFLRRRLAPAWAGLLALLVFQTPVVAYHGTSGAADVPEAFCVLAAGLLLADWAERGRREQAVLSALLFGVAGLVKPEGLTIALAGTTIFLFLARRRRLPAREVILPALALIACSAPWLALRLAWKIPSFHLSEARLPGGFALLDRASTIAQTVWEQARPWGGWELSWTCVALGLCAFLWATRRARGVTVLWLLLGWQSAVFTAIYLTCPYEVEWYLGASLHRVMLQLMPLGLAAAVASAAPPLPQTAETEPALAAAEA